MTADGILAKINRPAPSTMLRDRYDGDQHLLQDVQGCSLKGTKESMALQDQITVKGTLDEDWSDWFDGLRITHAPPVTSSLRELFAIRPRSTA